MTPLEEELLKTAIKLHYVTLVACFIEPAAGLIKKRLATAEDSYSGIILTPTDAGRAALGLKADTLRADGEG